MYEGRWVLGEPFADGDAIAFRDHEVQKKSSQAFSARCDRPDNGEQTLIRDGVACVQTLRQFQNGHVAQLNIVQLRRATELVEIDEQEVLCVFGFGIACRSAATERESARIDPLPVHPEELDVNLWQGDLQSLLWLAFGPVCVGESIEPLQPAAQLRSVEGEALLRWANKSDDHGVVVKVSDVTVGSVSLVMFYGQ